jgi:hypothetical protein
MQRPLLPLLALTFFLLIAHLDSLDRAGMPHPFFSILALLDLFFNFDLHLALLHHVAQVQLAAKSAHALRVLVQQRVGSLDALLALRSLKCCLLPILHLAPLLLLVERCLTIRLLLPPPRLKRVVPSPHSCLRHVTQGLAQRVIIGLDLIALRLGICMEQRRLDAHEVIRGQHGRLPEGHDRCACPYRSAGRHCLRHVPRHTRFCLITAPKIAPNNVYRSLAPPICRRRPHLLRSSRTRPSPLQTGQRKLWQFILLSGGLALGYETD